MPAAIPLAIAAASGVAQVAGAKIGSNAATSAAKTQQDAAQQAMAQQQRATADANAYAQAAQRQSVQRSNPYQQVGNQAMANLSAMFGGGAAPSGALNGNQYAGRPTLPAQAPPSPYTQAMPPQGQGVRLVTVQAPTGETRQLPPEQAQKAVQMGARVVG